MYVVVYVKKKSNKKVKNLIQRNHFKIVKCKGDGKTSAYSWDFVVMSLKIYLLFLIFKLFCALI